MTQRLSRLRIAASLNSHGRRSRIPIVPFVLLIPSWISAILLERPGRQEESLFFLYVTELTRDPIEMIPGLVVGPLLNTAFGQTVLVSGLVLFFGIPLERRLGAARTLAIFWGTSIVASVAAAAIMHGLHAAAPDVEIVERAWTRAYGGGSAGGFGLMGAFVAASRSPLPWIGLFVVWEIGAWFVVLQNLTPLFHVAAFLAGIVAGRVLFGGRSNVPGGGLHLR